MRRTATAEKDSPAAVNKATPWYVIEVAALPQHRLHVRFADGTCGEVDMSQRIARHDAGVFAALRDPEVFVQVHLEYGAVTWPGELDLAPDAMHAEIKAHGVWLLT